MHDPDLDTVYTALANALAEAGERRELFLSMLCLRLIGRSGDWTGSLAAIRQTLDALAAHGDIPSPSAGDTP